MIHLRPIISADIAEIKNWPPYEQDFAQMDYAIREKGWLAEFRNVPDARLYAVEEKARVIGFSLLSITREREAEFRIALHPRRLGKGLGEEATRTTLNIGFDQFGLESIYLIVRKNNPRAARLYERVGFVKIGESVHTIQKQRVEFFDMIMTRASFKGESR